MSDAPRTSQELSPVLEEFRPLPPVTGRIWHLTDLHFDPTNLPGSPDGKAGFKGASASEFSNEDHEEIFRLVRDPQTRPDVLIFGGDFIDASKLGNEPAKLAFRNRLKQKFGYGPPPVPPDQTPAGRRKVALEYAARFVGALTREAGLADRCAQRVVVCPGNHDVDWSKPSGSDKRNLEDFEAAFKPYLRPSCGDPFLLDEALGLCVMALDTAWLGGTEVTSGRAKFTHDVSAFSLDAVRRGLERLKKATKRKEPPNLPPSVLGLVVAHHAPGVVATAVPELKAFEVPVAAAQAKQALYNAGFRGMLHGHKHIPVAQHERLRVGGPESQEMLVIGSANFGGPGTSAGFSIIDYAIAPDCGEARIRVQHYVLVNNRPQRLGDPWRFAIAPATHLPARITRLCETIDQDGGSRTDMYFELPVPTSESRQFNWTLSDGNWTRRLRRVVEMPGGNPTDPLVAPSDRRASARYEGQYYDAGIGTRCGEIEVQVPRDLSAITVVERCRGVVAYAITRAHQHRIWGDVPTELGLQFGEDGFGYLIREPTEVFEIEVEFPEALADAAADAELTAFVEVPGGSSLWKKDLLSFSQWHFERSPFARKLRAVIRHPLLGVGYHVKWPLPEDPYFDRASAQQSKDFFEALSQTDKLRASLVEHAMPNRAHPTHKWFVEFTERVERVLENELKRLSAKDDCELAFFVPDRTLKRFGAAQTRREHPGLVPVLANFGKSTDRRWSQRWLAGQGLAGACYAINRALTHNGPKSGNFEGPKDEWFPHSVSPYINFDAGIHSVLIAIPVLSPWRVTDPDIVIGCLCLGTYLDHSTMKLSPDDMRFLQEEVHDVLKQHIDYEGI